MAQGLPCQCSTTAERMVVPVHSADISPKPTSGRPSGSDISDDPRSRLCPAPGRPPCRPPLVAHAPSGRDGHLSQSSVVLLPLDGHMRHACGTCRSPPQGVHCTLDVGRDPQGRRPSKKQSWHEQSRIRKANGATLSSTWAISGRCPAMASRPPNRERLDPTSARRRRSRELLGPGPRARGRGHGGGGVGWSMARRR